MRRGPLALAALAALAAGGTLTAVVEWPIPDVLRGRISEKVESYLGARLAYRDGGVSVLRGVRLGGVVLTGTEGETVTIGEAHLVVAPREFFSFLLGGGDVVLGAVEARDVELPITRRRDGRIVVPLAPRERSGRFVIRIEGGRVRYRDLPLAFDRIVGDVEAHEARRGQSRVIANQVFDKSNVISEGRAGRRREARDE